MLKCLFSITISILIIFTNTTLAQSLSGMEEVLYPSQIKLSVIGMAYSPLKFDGQEAKLMRSLPTPGGEFAISYYRQIKSGFGVTIGLGIGSAPFHFSYSYNTEPGNMFFDAGYHEIDMSIIEYDQAFYLVFPLAIHQIIPLKKVTLSFESGARLSLQTQHPDNYPLLTGYTDQYLIGSHYEDAFHLRLNTNQPTNVGIYLKAGVMKTPTLYRPFSIEYSLIASWSPQTFREGEFEFHNIGIESHGQVYSSLSFIGLAISFGLDFPRYTRL